MSPSAKMSCLVTVVCVGCVACSNSPGNDPIGGSAGTPASAGSQNASGGSGGSAIGSDGGSAGVVANCTLQQPGSVPLKIACIGDSITFGYGADPDQSYPSQLAGLLGAGYAVGNYGVSATTMLKNGSYSYWTYGKLPEAEAFLLNVVVIALGTNDMGTGSSAYLSEFTGDYVEMVQLFQNLESHPVVFAVYPPWEKDDDPGIGYTDQRLREEIIPRITQAAAESGACIIDLHSVTENHPEYYFDKLHPNATGYAVIANTVCNALVPGCH